MPACLEPKHPGTVLSKFPELVCSSPGYVPSAHLQFTSVNSRAWPHLCLSLHNHWGSALFKPHLIMQFNCSKNNSFAEYATVSSLYFGWGESEGKGKFPLKFRHFYGAFPMWKRQGALCLTPDSPRRFSCCVLGAATATWTQWHKP